METIKPLIDKKMIIEIRKKIFLSTAEAPPFSLRCVTRAHISPFLQDYLQTFPPHLSAPKWKVFTQQTPQLLDDFRVAFRLDFKASPSAKRRMYQRDVVQSLSHEN